MSRPLKPATDIQVMQVAEALRHLALARDYLKAAGADRSVMRVRLAIDSAQGAQRHIVGRFTRSNPSQA